MLERYRDRPPKVEELAERYEAEIDEWAETLRQLQEENALLVHQDCEEATPSRTPTRRISKGTALRQHKAAREVRQLEAQLAALRRRTRVNEWYLAQLKAQLQETAKILQGKENHLKDLRERFDAAGEHRQRLREEQVRTQQMLESERQELVQLHQEALALREACFLPAQLKKKSSVLTKFLEEGGRHKMEKHLRGRDTVTKLYKSVAEQAPELQALAGRAKSEMDAAFARYQQLQLQHSRLLQQLRLDLARDALSASPERSKVVEGKLR
ncbi:unnamed protein product [Effrenium voratum]|nr:unnamed protein product [Effrenium voratum]